MILKDKATIENVKSNMSKVPGNIFNPCANSMNTPNKRGINKQYLPCPN